MGVLDEGASHVPQAGVWYGDCAMKYVAKKLFNFNDLKYGDALTVRQMHPQSSYL